MACNSGDMSHKRWLVGTNIQSAQEGTAGPVVVADTNTRHKHKAQTAVVAEAGPAVMAEAQTAVVAEAQTAVVAEAQTQDTKKERKKQTSRNQFHKNKNKTTNNHINFFYEK